MHKNMLEPSAAHHKVYTENTHNDTTLYTTFRLAFATTVALRHPCARRPTEPTSHSASKTDSFFRDITPTAAIGHT